MERKLSTVIILVLMLISFFSAIVLAGPNENAGIEFDLDATTYGNQNLTSIPSQPAGTYIRLDVYCIGVHNLDTYEFEVIYDPAVLSYLSSSATNPITFEGNILESNGGTALGSMIDNSTPGILSIAYTLTGTDTLEAPEGEGLIADIVFQALVATHGTLTFGDGYFYDSYGVVDLITFFDAPAPPVATVATTNGTLTFFANWEASAGAIGYYLDVATDADFTTFLSGYENLEVLDLTYPVTAEEAIEHYYRLRAYNAYGTSSNSNVIVVSGSTLPVELAAFTAAYVTEYNSISICWATASETDVIGFNIYRNTEDDFGTADPINVELIQGHGTTSEMHEYSFEDVTFEPETTYYYWLESIEYGGGNHRYGSIEYIPEEGEGGFVNDFDKNMLANYPNPFSGSTTIEYAIKGKLKAEPIEIRIYNVAGQLVETIEARYGTTKWNVNNLPTGVYFYQLKTENYNEVKKMLLIK